MLCVLLSGDFKRKIDKWNVKAFYSTKHAWRKELLPVSTNKHLFPTFIGAIKQYNPKVTEHGLWVIPSTRQCSWSSAVHAVQKDPKTTARGIYSELIQFISICNTFSDDLYALYSFTFIEILSKHVFEFFISKEGCISLKIYIISLVACFYS